jgi:hypothetical protein
MKWFGHHWIGLFLQKLNEAVLLKATSCLPRVKPFQYDLEDAKHNEIKRQENKILRKQNTDETDADIWTRQVLKL